MITQSRRFLLSNDTKLNSNTISILDLIIAVLFNFYLKMFLQHKLLVVFIISAFHRTCNATPFLELVLIEVGRN